MAFKDAGWTELDITRLHESEVRDRRTGLGVRFVTVPAASLGPLEPLGNPGDVMELLELEQVSPALPPSLVPYAVASILIQGENADHAAEHFRLVFEHAEDFVMDHPEVLAFAEYVTYANVVPVEHSPLSADSLSGLMGKSVV